LDAASKIAGNYLAVLKAGKTHVITSVLTSYACLEQRAQSKDFCCQATSATKDINHRSSSSTPLSPNKQWKTSTELWKALGKRRRIRGPFEMLIQGKSHLSQMRTKLLSSAFV
jgi:hypothetical protein